MPLTEFRRKVQGATRLKPDGTRTETKERFGQSTLARWNVYASSVLQPASRIAEGAGILQVMQTTEGKTTKRPDVRVNEPCHVIVIENFQTTVRETARAENRQLRAGRLKVKKYLLKLQPMDCIYERSAEYTSRLIPELAPGIRRQDVAIKESCSLLMA